MENPLEDLLLKYAREESPRIRPLVPGREHLLERTAKAAIIHILQEESVCKCWQGCQDTEERTRMLTQCLLPMLRDLLQSGLGLPM